MSSPTPAHFNQQTKQTMSHKQDSSSHWIRKILQILFIIIGIISIIAMVMFSPKEGKMVCQTSGHSDSSLIAVGTCATE